MRRRDSPTVTLDEQGQRDYAEAMNAMVRCVACGQTHGVLSAAEAREQVESFHRESKRGGWGQLASYERNFSCSRCGADSGRLLPAVQLQREAGQTVQCVIVDR